MNPVRSNIQSKTCANPIGTDCVIVSDSCGPVSLTTKLQQLEESATCCEGSFPAGHVSCHTGSWVTFSSSIPASGSSTSCTWTIDTSVTAFGPPQYKWEKNGDLKVRGGFRLVVTPLVNVGVGSVAMIGLIPTCFPTGWTASQFNITAVDPLTSTLNSAVILAGGVNLDYPTGNLSFGFSYTDAPLAVIISDISLGGTTFNLA